MAGFLISRTDGGRLRVRMAGCCGDPERVRREYEQAFLEQTLADGGTVVSSGPDGVQLVDRKGRLHRLGPHVTLAGQPASDSSAGAAGVGGGGAGGGCG